MLKSFNYYKKSKKYEDGLSIYIPTLNNENTLEECLINAKEKGFDQIIVVDGKSKDNSFEIAKKYADDCVQTEPGLHIQTLKAITLIKFKFLVLSEADVLLSDDFAKISRKEIEKLNSSVCVSQLTCKYKRNYLERGFSNFIKSRRKKPGKEIKAIGGPAIIYSEIYLDSFKNSYLTKDTFGNFDTNLSEIILNNNQKIKMMKAAAEQNEEINLEVILLKFIWYGKGDYFFYKRNKKNWNLIRKIKSIFHTYYSYLFLTKTNNSWLVYFYFLPVFIMFAIIRNISWYFYLSKAIFLHILNYKIND